MNRILIIFILTLPMIGIHSKSSNYYVNKNYVLKAKPIEDDKSLIGPVYPGDQVKLDYVVENMLDPDNEFAKVTTDSGSEGYIPFIYLQTKKPSETVLRSRNIISFQEQTYFVTVGSLSLRSGPGLQFDSITQLPRNSQMRVIKFSTDDDYINGVAAKWAQVRIGPYTEGWVFGGYISLQKASGSSSSEEPWDHILSGGSKFVRPPTLRVRDEPGKFGNVISTISQNERVSILERKEWTETIMGHQSIWVKVRSGVVEGWVFGGFLSDRSGLTLNSDDVDKPFIYPLPVNAGRKTGSYGRRIHPVRKTQSFHTGLDVGAPNMTPIYAAADGVVTIIRDSGKVGFGKLTVIQHNNGLVTYYAHQHQFGSKQGDRVKAGDTIGYVGTTGTSTGNHLHFEVRTGFNQDHFDPEQLTVVPW
ncbi:MAG: peptidoglycan DD-metalloendopeptidase family protein [Leptospira sp.]|nr:peptidoglycan DD-metalloendopeptidase family protein [Leptospira sp.]